MTDLLHSSLSDELFHRIPVEFLVPEHMDALRRTTNVFLSRHRHRVDGLDLEVAVARLLPELIAETGVREHAYPLYPDLRPHPISVSEDVLFAEMGEHEDFRKFGLYRDGAPEPATYAVQPVKVLFVLREPNLRRHWERGEHTEGLDMRVQLRSNQPTVIGGARGWWRNKVGALAHAVHHAQRETDCEAAWERFCLERDVPGYADLGRHLFPFAFMQMKKTGGGGQSVASEIQDAAVRHRAFIRRQIAIYDPDVIIGFGQGAGAPAALLHDHVLRDLDELDERPRLAGRFRWWLARRVDGRPRTLLEFNHPSARTSRKALYSAMWHAFPIVADAVQQS